MIMKETYYFTERKYILKMPMMPSRMAIFQKYTRKSWW